ncbi:MAG: ribokinase, partial [Acidimicrobiaceae bacterium]|nr:ribokinase [Acidimicrobiaceae bacterium]
MADDQRSGPEVAVVGSANLDLVVEVETIPVAGETVLGGDLRLIPGGKGANQAVAAARLGRRVAMIGRVGDDDAGRTLRSAMDSAGVDTTSLLTTEGAPSGTALIAVGADGDNAIVVSPGANGHLSSADVEGATGVLAAADVVLLQLEVPLEAVSAAVRGAGGTVVLNPAPAPATMLPPDLLDRVDVIVPNQT